MEISSSACCPPTDTLNDAYSAYMWYCAHIIHKELLDNRDELNKMPENIESVFDLCDDFQIALDGCINMLHVIKPSLSPAQVKRDVPSIYPTVRSMLLQIVNLQPTVDFLPVPSFVPQMHTYIGEYMDVMLSGDIESTWFVLIQEQPVDASEKNSLVTFTRGCIHWMVASRQHLKLYAIGSKLAVLFPCSRKWYIGTVSEINSTNTAITIQYYDGDTITHKLDVKDTELPLCYMWH